MLLSADGGILAVPTRLSEKPNFSVCALSIHLVFGVKIENGEFGRKTAKFRLGGCAETSEISRTPRGANF